MVTRASTASAVDAPIIPILPHATGAPVVLSAQPLLSACPALAEGMRAAKCELLLVASWNHLLQGIEKTLADVVVVDMDAVERAHTGHHTISGHRLVALLARRLAAQAQERRAPATRLAVLTRLDYTEIEDLMRMGIHILGRPDHDPDAFVAGILAAGAYQRATSDAPPSKSIAAGAATKTTPAAADQTPPWRLPDAVWLTISAMLPTANAAPGKGRSRQRVGDRVVMEGLCYMLRLGGAWSNYPTACGAISTARRRLLRWRATNVFARLGELAQAGDTTLQRILALPWGRLATSSVAPNKKALSVTAPICV